MIDLAELRDENRSAVRRWHEAALHDLELAELLAERGFYSDACFYAQQTAEKALKAFLRARGLSPWGHRVEELLRAAAEEGLDVADLLSPDRIGQVKSLSDQYLAPRYPDFRERMGLRLEDYTRERAQTLIELAREVLRRVEVCLRREGWI